MPRKQKKTSKEEKLVENYFPINKDDIKYSVEKKYSRPNYASLETVIKKNTKRKSFKKKPRKKAPKKN